VFRHLQIPYRQERWLVGLADAGLNAARFLGWPRTSRQASPAIPRRILLLRLERVGDLVMVLEAIALVRAMAPDAAIDLVVGSWNRALAGLIPSVSAIETLDVPWLAREGSGLSWGALIARAKAWRRKGYDLAINFEPDIRSNFLLAMSGAQRRVGFISGGGGAFLTDPVSPDPRAHIADNAKTLVERAFETTGLKPCATGAGSATDASVAQGFSPATLSPAILTIPDDARRRAVELVGRSTTGAPLVGIQPAAGRQVKEWDPIRFAQVGAEIARARNASVMLIGSVADKPVLEMVLAAWPADVPLLELPVETDLVVLAAVLERLSLFITGDTGPMHLAAAVGTPVLAILGPSLPTRYAPLSRRSRIVRIDIHCSPCNLMRRPPARCLGHVPDCLSGIDSALVLRAANEMLDAS
jgi:ADP-heptose:LPS heptosyltransferase